jgi:hypothetical protein
VNTKKTFQQNLDIGFSNTTTIEVDSQVYTVRLLRADVPLDSNRTLVLRLVGGDTNTSTILDPVVAENGEQTFQSSAVTIPDPAFIREQRLARFEGSKTTSEASASENYRAEIEFNSTDTDFVTQISKKLISKFGFLPRSEFSLRSASTGNVIEPVSLDNMGEANLEANCHVFADSIKRPLGRNTESGRINLSQEEGIDSIERILTYTCDQLRSEVSNATKLHIQRILRLIETQKEALAQNVDDISRGVTTPIFENTAEYDYNIFESFAQLIVDNAATLGLQAIYNIIKRPYILQYLLLILFSAVVKFTYLGYFNLSCLSLSKKFAAAFDSIYLETKDIRGHQKNKAKLDKELSSIVEIGKRKIQMEAVKNSNNDVITPNYNFKTAISDVASLMGRAGLGILGLIGINMYGNLISRAPSQVPPTIVYLSTPPAPPAATPSTGLENNSIALISLGASLGGIAVSALYTALFFLKKM